MATYLSSHERSLLDAALNSNKKPTALSTTNLNMNSMDFKGSPSQQTPGSGTLGGFNDSPFIDDYYDFDIDGQFDFDASNDVLQGQMIGKLPESSASPDGEDNLHDKRSHPDEEEEEEGGGKRREGEDKTSKKPGRKPLTSEPTSKRKAQNRAAQRAFRERKEKHLKDLELKVQDLEKASETTNHENTLLRAQIEKLTMELREYKKRLSLNGRNGPLTGALPPYLAGKGFGSSLNQPNGVNFQFEFPKFGSLPGPPVLNNGTFPTDQRNSTSMSASSYQVPGVLDRNPTSPLDQFTPRSNSVSTADKSPNQFNPDDMSSFSGLFSPSILENASKNLFENSLQGTRTNGSRASTDQNSSGQSTSYNSPADSSTSHNEPSSSCGTSPEPSTQSPNLSKPLDTTLGKGSEEPSNGELTFCEKLNMACGNPNNPIPQTMSKNCGTSADTTAPTPSFDFDFFAQQNGGQFDPVLFGDYREPQDNYLLNGDITDSFFNDSSFPLGGFQSPFNAGASPAPKVDLLKEIDEKQNADDEEVVPADNAKMLTCSNIWEQLQTCPHVQDEGFDLNDLCTKLQKQAKCSETGAVVDEKDFKAIMREFAKSDGSQALDAFTRDSLKRNINFGSSK